MMTERSVGPHCSIEIKDEEEYMKKEGNGSNQTSIGNRDEKAIVSSIQGQLCSTSPLLATRCIFRVPDILRRANEKVFVPKLISIGPFHHKKKKLQAMKKLKLWYLHCLLHRKPTPETSLECFVKGIGIIEQHCRECYAEKDCFNEKEFVEMMVVDGCFIIEFFRKVKNAELVDEDDPVFNTSWMFTQIATELLLLENQLPWRVLTCLFDMTDDKSETLAGLVVHSYSELAPSKVCHLNNNMKNKHLLDFLRNCLLGSNTDTELEQETSWIDRIPSVTELLQAGVKFELQENKYGVLITFEDGVMKIPETRVWENTETLLRNLVAFEQCDKMGKNKITSYIVLLDNLINNSKDVDVLAEKNIVRINNSLNTEDTASFFNRLADNVEFNYFRYEDLCRRVNDHYKTPYNKWQATLKRDYFNNPWSILSFIAAIIVLLFTFLQTLYSILSYY